MFYAYESIRKCLLTHAYWALNALTFQRLLAVLCRFGFTFYVFDA
ncbi:hypothetical protein ACFWNT_47945 [Streptomyces sp. NPDC058409]